MGGFCFSTEPESRFSGPSVLCKRRRHCVVLRRHMHISLYLTTAHCALCRHFSLWQLIWYYACAFSSPPISRTRRPMLACSAFFLLNLGRALLARRHCSTLSPLSLACTSNANRLEHCSGITGSCSAGRRRRHALLFSNLATGHYAHW